MAKTKTAGRAVEVAHTNLEIAEAEERDAALAMERVRHEAATLREREPSATETDSHQARYAEAGARYDAAREATRRAAAALSDARKNADEETVDDPEDPAVFRWTRCKRLQAVRDETVTAERRLQELDDAEGHHRQAVDAAKEHRRRIRALVAVGGAAAGDVTKAEKAVADAERAQDAHEGERLILREKLENLREQARVEAQSAQARVRQRARREYVQAITHVAEVLHEAQTYAVRAERIWRRTEENFPVRSPEAEAHGAVAGLGSLPMAPRWLLPGTPNDGIAGVGGYNYWLSEVADLFRRNGLDREALDREEK